MILALALMVSARQCKSFRRVYPVEQVSSIFTQLLNDLIMIGGQNDPATMRRFESIETPIVTATILEDVFIDCSIVKGQTECTTVSTKTSSDDENGENGPTPSPWHG